MTLKKLIVILLLATTAGVAVIGTKSLAVDSTKTEKDKPAAAAPAKAAVAVDAAPLSRDARLGTSYASVVKKAAPSVVYISTSKTVKNPHNWDQQPFMPDDLFRRFFGDQFGGRRLPREFKQRGLGSGVVVTKDGYILTNNHVVDGADEIKVTLANKEKREFTAKVVGRDPKTDIAVLKVEAKDLPFVALADSDKLEVGDVVLAVGNPFGVGQTVTMGIVSATGRGGLGIEEYEDFIQTDAAINPGNSGGALVDTEGRLVGINTAILSRSGGNMGVGFAVPSNLAHDIMDRLLKGGKVSRGYLGVLMQELDPELAKTLKAPENTTGVIVADVMAKSAAADAGLKPKDIIVALNGKPVQDPRSLKLAVGKLNPGDKVEVKVLRRGEARNYTITLKELTDDVASVTKPQEGGEVDALDGVTVGDIDQRTRAQFKLPSDLTKGAVITEIDPNSTGYEAGLREGDVLLEIDDKPVANAEEAVEISKHVKSKRFQVWVWSGGVKRFVVVDESKKK
ncbi:MAG: DegQ family serine endoprotease [Verrucomicrobia bacterium]|nr:DegQ family serine endoprotease [Verrucomicrobiota bacterium]